MAGKTARAPRELRIEYVKASALKPMPGNPRKNEAAIPKVVGSIERFGWTNPILARKADRVVVAGHTRLEAAKRLGIDKVPVIWLGLSPVDAKLYALADNKLNEIAEWDDEGLAAILKQLRDEDAPLATAGFDDDEVERILAEVEADRLGEVEEDEDAVSEPPEKPESVPGEVYELGPHRLLCGDCRDIGRLEDLCGVEVDLLWTDPPYNVAIGITDLAEAKARRRRVDGKGVANDKMGDEEFRSFLRECFSAGDAAMRNGAVFYIAHADSEGYNFRGAVRDVGWKLAQTLIWAKDRFVLGRQDYQWQHEPILYGWKLGAGHHELVDRTQTTLLNVKRPGRSEDHPTMKPVELVEIGIRNSTNAADVVLDLFGGSGTTLIAAAKTGRKARLVELDPGYCDVIRRRWAKFEEAARKRA